MKKTIIAMLLFALVVLVVVLVVVPLLGSRFAGLQRKPGTILGEWTANTPNAGVSVYKYGTISRSTTLGFGQGGREIVDAWVAVPHHPRPLPIETIGHYDIQGDTLIQSVPAHSNTFSTLGLGIAQSSAHTTLTSHFSVNDNQLVLTQPETGKSVSLTLTAAAIPPSSPAGAGPGKGH